MCDPADEPRFQHQRRLFRARLWGRQECGPIPCELNNSLLRRSKQQATRPQQMSSIGKRVMNGDKAKVTPATWENHSQSQNFRGTCLLKDQKLAAPPAALLSLLERRMKNLILLQKGKRKRRVKGGQESKFGTHLHHSFGSAQENIFSL